MIFFNKENGFPVNISIETMSVEYPIDEWQGYESIVCDEVGEVVTKFNHNTLNGRVHWANGFFAGLKFKNKINEDEKITTKQY